MHQRPGGIARDFIGKINQGIPIFDRGQPPPLGNVFLGVVVSVLSAQKNIEQEELENPMLDLYSVGILAHVSNVTPFPNGCVKVVLEGDCVVDLRSITTKDNFLMVTVSAHKPAITDADKSPRFETVLTQFKEYSLHRNISEGMVDALFTMDSQINAFYGMIPFLQISMDERQRLLPSGHGAEGHAPQAVWRRYPSGSCG